MVCIMLVYCEQYISLSFYIVIRAISCTSDRRYRHACAHGCRYRNYRKLLGGCILRQLASVKLSVQVNFYLTKIRAEPYKNN